MNKALAAIGRGIKSFTMIFPRGISSTFHGMMTRTRFDYERSIGDGMRSSIIMACVNWVTRTFPEAPVMVMKRGPDGQYAEVIDHRMVRLLEKPNGWYSGALLWMGVLADFYTNGNAYVLKDRSAAGLVVRLWYLPRFMVHPIWAQDGSTFISAYRYTVNGIYMDIDPLDMIHFRWGMDPSNMRIGLSPLASLFREVFTDDEAGNFSASLLRNMGMPGVIISPDKEGSELTAEDAKGIRESYMEKFGGDSRGLPMVISAAAKIQAPPSFTPEQMGLTALRRVPEERITAVLGIPAIVAGLGAGLDRSTYANFGEAREAAYESHIIPLQRLLGAELLSQLLVDFEGANLDGWKVAWDLSLVRVLQDDQDKLYARLSEGVRGGYVTIAEARRAVKLPVTPADNVYLRYFAQAEVPIGGTMADGITLPAKPKPMTVDDIPADDPNTKPGKAMVKAQHAGGRDAAIRKAIPILTRFFDEQGKRVASRVKLLDGIEAKANPMPKSELEALKRVLLGIQEDAATRGWSDALVRIGLDPSRNVSTRTLMKLGDRITNIDETTRSAVDTYLRNAADNGLSGAEAADGLKNIGAFGEARAAMIARTEIATAENVAAIDSWRETEMVDEVEIIDGDGCGWEDHDDPDEADGSTRSLDDFEEYPTSHPNCVRDGMPIIAKARHTNGHNRGPIPATLLTI